TGEVTDVELSDKLAEAFNRLPGGAVSADMVKQMAQQGLPNFPTASLEIGDSWATTKRVESPKMGTMVVTTTYRYDGPREADGRALEAFTTTTDVAPDTEAGPAPLEVETVDSTGELLFDPAAGRLVSSTSDQRMNVTVPVPGGSVTSEMRQSFELRELAAGEGLTLAESAAASASPASPAE
ncbi:MAG: hypothetical protein AAF805_01640, partial [Planctomycetota bacterium]